MPGKVRLGPAPNPSDPLDLRGQEMRTKTQLEEIQAYLTDASNMPGGHAEKLFVPESAEEISEILREANEAKVPVTI